MHLILLDKNGLGLGSYFNIRKNKFIFMVTLSFGWALISLTPSCAQSIAGEEFCSRETLCTGPHAAKCTSGSVLLNDN